MLGSRQKGKEFGRWRSDHKVVSEVDHDDDAAAKVLVYNRERDGAEEEQVEYSLSEDVAALLDKIQNSEGSDEQAMSLLEYLEQQEKAEQELKKSSQESGERP